MNDLAFRVGEQCDNYEILSLIAVGGSGEVYRAVQRSTDREVALKCLQFRHVARRDLKARMQMESRALGRINHPNVVTVFDAGCTDAGVVWIAMELLVGHTLREILQERWRLPVREAAACAIDVGEGLAAAHEQQIIHRDIKPENVFVTERGIVKVLDLGTAKLHGWGELKSTDKGRVIGTPAYMAPEHIRCAGVDERTDVYAVGLLLYEALAGHPFAHLVHLDDYQEVARLQLYGRPRPLTEVVEGVPSQLSEVVLRALSKTPEERPQTMSRFVMELRDAAGIAAPVVHVTPRQPRVDAERRPSERPGEEPFGPHGTVRIVPVSRAAPGEPQAVQPTPPVSWAVGRRSEPVPGAPEHGSRVDGIPSEDDLSIVQERGRIPRWVWASLGVGCVLGVVVGTAGIWFAKDEKASAEPTPAASVPQPEVAGSSDQGPEASPRETEPAEATTHGPAPARSAVARIDPTGPEDTAPPATKVAPATPVPPAATPPAGDSKRSPDDLGPLDDEEPAPVRPSSTATSTGRSLPGSGL